MWGLGLLGRAVGTWPDPVTPCAATVEGATRPMWPVWITLDDRERARRRRRTTKTVSQQQCRA